MSKDKTEADVTLNRVNVVLLALVCLCVFPALVCGEVLTVVDTDYSLAPNTSQTVEVPQFDQEFGATLLAVRIILSAEARSIRVIFDNEGVASLTEQDFTATSAVKLVQGAEVLAKLLEGTTTSSNIRADDDFKPDYAGTDTVIVEGTYSADRAVELLEAEDYTGSETVSMELRFDISATSTWTRAASRIDSAHPAEGHLEVEYIWIADCDGDGIPDGTEPDSDGDGVIDDCEHIYGFTKFWVDSYVVIGGETTTGHIEVTFPVVSPPHILLPVEVVMSSSNPKLAQVPAPITVNPPGFPGPVYTSFPITTGTVPVSQSVSLAARHEGNLKTATLVVLPNGDCDTEIHNITKDTCHVSIQAAINESVDGDEIVVAPGRYMEAIDFIGKAITLRSSDPEDPNVVESTIIDGSGYQRVVQCVNDEGPNTILAGFTVTGGGTGMFNKNSNPSVTNCTFTDNWNGGMANESSNPIVHNCMFSANRRTYQGGGMHNLSSSPIVTNCIFLGNGAEFEADRNVELIGGGGIYNYRSNPVIAKCVFIGNYLSCSYVFGGGFAANGGGGGMLNHESNPSVIDCSFIENLVLDAGIAGLYEPVGKGGGVFNLYSNPDMANCTFAGNQIMPSDLGTFGAGMCNERSDPNLTNCTFVGNEGPMFVEGKGICNIGSNPVLANCIIWEGADNSIDDDIDSSSTVNYSNIEGGWTGAGGEGNIDIDPLFVDPTSMDPPFIDPPTYDLQLQPDSPCIDAGDSNAVSLDITTDLAGRRRFVDDPLTVDTGIPTGNRPAVDMGAYEYACEGNVDSIASVTLSDLAVIGEQWEQEDCGNCGFADLTGDHRVNHLDLLFLAENWLCGTSP